MKFWLALFIAAISVSCAQRPVGEVQKGWILENVTDSETHSQRYRHVAENCVVDIRKDGRGLTAYASLEERDYRESATIITEGEDIEVQASAWFHGMDITSSQQIGYDFNLFLQRCKAHIGNLPPEIRKLFNGYDGIN